MDNDVTCEVINAHAVWIKIFDGLVMILSDFKHVLELTKRD